MESFIARQPIFDAQRNVYGYELFPFLVGKRIPAFGPESGHFKVMDAFPFQHERPRRREGLINVPREILLKEYMFFLPRKGCRELLKRWADPEVSRPAKAGKRRLPDRHGRLCRISAMSPAGVH
jgi:hypothetical protein